ncbi:MAG: hypothetical protein DME25_02900 [Verrucomicrobia bacterium]|nr:MAG: hypothetical protein DME25_02900 [Verrucomicrobiota bacterium]
MENFKLFSVLACSVTACGPGSPALAASMGKAEHVVVIVWDGMRPDSISPQHTPTLHRLAQQGAWFKQHHAVYVPTTEVNGVALNTGDKLKPVAAEDPDVVRRGDLVTHGHYLPVPTLAEIFQETGFRTAICGTKAVPLLFDRSDKRTSPAAGESAVFYNGHALPPSAMAKMLTPNEGHPFPAQVTFPNLAQDQWTTTALTRGLWNHDVPRFSLLWLSDPDFTQHERGPGSKPALAALDSADRNLAAVLQRLEELNVRDKTDVFVVSDHGFSTVERSVDIVAALKQAGFNTVKELHGSQTGEVLVVTLNGSVSLYVPGHDETTIRKLAAFFQSSDFAGVIFCRLQVEGTFPLEQIRIAAAHAPDLLVSMRWSAGHNEFGTPGLLVAASDKKPKGAHGALSPFDTHNTLVAAGPDFRQGFSDDLPTGNADLAPTILWILGLKPPQPMDGRLLSEALAGLNPPESKVERTRIEARHDLEGFRWHQYLSLATLGESIYFDEGNAESVAK